LKAGSTAFIIISENSLKSALCIIEGMIFRNRGSVEPELSEVSFFIQQDKKELMRQAEEYISMDIFKDLFFNVGIIEFAGFSRKFLNNLFKKYDRIIFFLALGATVRIIAPFIKDKLTDPAVIVIDENRKFAISLLSGHIGGANEFAAEAADFLGAVPVITTATDVLKIFSLDMFAKNFGLFIEGAKSKIKEFNAASLGGEKFEILVKNDFKNREIKSYINGLNNAKDFNFVDKFNELELNNANIIVISMREDFKKNILGSKIAVLRPKCLAVGIGCNKNTSFEEIENFILSIFAENNLSINSIRNIATIDLKFKEKGILQFGEKYAEFIDFFTKEEINDFISDSGKNEKSPCFRHTGAYSVCEPCAVLSAKNKAGELLIYKQKKGNVTMAVSEAG
jgi:cobalt-precorrin 5A hydrolase